MVIHRSRAFLWRYYYTYSTYMYCRVRQVFRFFFLLHLFIIVAHSLLKYLLTAKQNSHILYARFKGEYQNIGSSYCPIAGLQQFRIFLLMPADIDV
jgi:hypothetical protein